MATLVSPDEYLSEDQTPTDIFVSIQLVSPNEYWSDPLNGSVEKDVRMGEMEEFIARKAPNTYALAMSALDLVPGAKYLVQQSERDKFMKLSPWEQSKTILWETFDAELYVGAPMILKGIGKGLKAGGRGVLRAFVKKPKVLPIEDAIQGIHLKAPGLATDPWSWNDTLLKKMKNLKLADDEGRMVADAIQSGDERKLIDVVVKRRYEGKNTTKAFDELTEWETAKAYPSKKLAAGVREKYGEAAMRGKHFTKRLEKALSKEVLKGKVGDLTPGIFRFQAQRLYPDVANKMTLANVGESEMSNIVLDLLSHKFLTGNIVRASQGSILPFSILPARVASDLGEMVFRTYSNVYNPMKFYMGLTNQANLQYLMTWFKMLEQRGQATMKIKWKSLSKVEGAKLWKAGGAKAEDVLEIKFGKTVFNAEDQNLAHKVLLAEDDIAEQLRRSGAKIGSPEHQQFVNASKANKAQLRGSPNAQALVDTWNDYSDFLYSEFMPLQIRRVLGKAGLTKDGREALDVLMTTKLNRRIKELFSTTASKGPVLKLSGTKEVLKDVRDVLEMGTAFDTKMVLGKQVKVAVRSTILEGEGEALNKSFTKLMGELTMQGEKGGNFLGYLENYAMRMAQQGDRQMNAWRQGMLDAMSQKAGFTKRRTLEVSTKPSVDFSTMVEARTFGQSKELFLYDGLEEIVNHVKKLPPAWIDYYEHFISRALNRPSLMDAKTATFLQKSVGSIERLFGKEGVWDEARVLRLAQNINNITYMGALGFKPFSIIRNLFQPLIMVPADLGGLRDIPTLMKGMVRATRLETRNYLRQIGAITEFAPEISMRPHALPFGKKVFGISQQRIDAVRDTALWGFRGSDRLNRYVTGAAAMEKWERVLRKVGGVNNELKTMNDLAKFSNKLGLGKRHSWVKRDIEDQLRRGLMDEAKAKYVLDVIADTQYLYGTLDAPSITGRSGLGRTGWIFQTWWMNYASTTEKWLRTGTSGTAKIDQMLTAMTSQAIAYGIMSRFWDEKTALRTVGTGPLPREFNEFMIPAAWTPLYHVVAGAVNLGQDPNVSERHIQAFFNSVPVFVPGGLQAKAFYKGARKEGFEGFMKAFVRYKGKED